MMIIDADEGEKPTSLVASRAAWGLQFLLLGGKRKESRAAPAPLSGRATHAKGFWLNIKARLRLEQN